MKTAIAAAEPPDPPRGYAVTFQRGLQYELDLTRGDAVPMANTTAGMAHTVTWSDRTNDAGWWDRMTGPAAPF